MLVLSLEERRVVIPLAVISQPGPDCIAVKPTSLDYVAIGQNRTVTAATLPEGISC